MSVRFYSADNEEANRENIGQLLERHTNRWDEKKGGAWWVEDFMAHNMIWWTDFQKDLKALLKAIPAKALNDVEDLKKVLLPYFKKRLLKPGAKPKNTPSPKKEKSQPVSVTKSSVEATEYDYNLAQTTVLNAKSKNEAMSLLRKAGFANNQIADFMKLKPGRVSSGIRAYDMSQDKKKPSHNLF